MLTRLCAWYLRRRGWFAVPPNENWLVLHEGSVAIASDTTLHTVNMRGGTLKILNEGAPADRAFDHLTRL